MYGEHLTALEDTFGVPVILVASRWRKHRAVDLDRRAARILLELFDGLPGDWDRHPDQLGLFLVGRGGRPAFANSVYRVLDGFDVDYQCFIPGVVTGAYALLALGADELVLHPYGGVGAYDAPPAQRLPGRVDLETLAAIRDHLSDEGWEASESLPRLAELAHLRKLSQGQLERVVDGTDEGMGARVAREMTVDRLGEELALGAGELESLGVPARQADEAEREVMWRLHDSIEGDLDLRGEVPERYTESDLGEEVEFERAQAIPGAVIESAYQSAVYELDTGEPDPETSMLQGSWAKIEDLQPASVGEIESDVEIDHEGGGTSP